MPSRLNLLPQTLDCIVLICKGQSYDPFVEDNLFLWSYVLAVMLDASCIYGATPHYLNPVGVMVGYSRRDICR